MKIGKWARLAFLAAPLLTGCSGFWDTPTSTTTYSLSNSGNVTVAPGASSTATITATQRSDVLLVPNTALRFTPTATNTGTPTTKGGIVSSLTPRMPKRTTTRKSAAEGASTAAARQVWVLLDGEAVSVAVTPGISDGRMTEITGGDLEVGMQVITDQKIMADK